jgi:hypothetical protein
MILNTVLYTVRNTVRITVNREMTVILYATLNGSL